MAEDLTDEMMDEGDMIEMDDGEIIEVEDIEMEPIEIIEMDVEDGDDDFVPPELQGMMGGPP